jgi:RNA polymerase sigma-70 factor, ECF subfamily
MLLAFPLRSDDSATPSKLQRDVDSAMGKLPGAFVVVDVTSRTMLAAKKGDSVAFEILCRRPASVAFRLVRRIVGTREEAEDIVQESLQKAFTHLKSFKGDSRFSTWLNRIAINAALMRLRKNKVRRELSLDELSISQPDFSRFDVEGQSLNPEQLYAQMEHRQMLCNAMNELNPRVRRALELRDLDERSTEETARMMGISIGAVKARVFHGRRKLRRLLNRRKPVPIHGNEPLRLSRNQNLEV